MSGAAKTGLRSQPHGLYPECPACGTPCGLDEPCPSCSRRPPKERIGTMLADRYRIDSVLGRGGFGVVYRATQVSLSQHVAVKFLLAEWARMPESRARFQREAAALVRLRHPGIVAAYDFGEDDGDLYLVMEWVPGKNLGDVLQDGEALPPARIVAILDQVLQVIELAHAQGIVHRDLKPENVMLVGAPPGERVKVLDFGLVLISDHGGKRLTASNAINGTCYYMAPEQCRGRDVGAKADIYAVGTMLFELLSGEPPFLADTAVDVMMQQIVMEPPRVRERGQKVDVHPGLEAIAQWCLQKKAEARPTASELRAELQAALKGTDRATRAEADALARVAAGGLSRNERAIGALEHAGTEAATSPISLRAEERPRVLVMGFDDSSADGLKSVLAMQGIRGLSDGDAAGANAIVVRGDDGAVARVEALRRAAQTAKVPILVSHVERPDRTPALIRAGASDVTLASVGDDVLAQKVWRLIRRKR